MTRSRAGNVGPVERVRHLVIGAGVSGLAYANAAHELEPDSRVLVLERSEEAGGLCKTVHRAGFTWDYSGHFFHFREPAIAEWLLARMATGEEVRQIRKRASVYLRGRHIDFPFQDNIHQLPHDDFLECVQGFSERLSFNCSEHDVAAGSFKERAYREYGKGIAERFMIPYNEKLYATDMNTLSRDAMGRFMPASIMATDTAKRVSTSYNAAFTYARSGAGAFITALLRDLPAEMVSVCEAVVSIDARTRVAYTTRRTIQFDTLISSAPLPELVRMCGGTVSPDDWNWNQVLVFNLGFDRKGVVGVHWIYFPERDVRFYRVGFYDNLFEDSRMSLYVEIGAPKNEVLDVAVELDRVLADLRRVGILTDHQLLSWHSVILDPAYVYTSERSNAARDTELAALRDIGIYSIGRYGGWRYCSIEDNIIEARALAASVCGSKR